MRFAAAIAPLVAALLVAAPASSSSRGPVRGGLLAFSSELHAAEVYAMKADGRGLRRLTDAAAPSRWPALSPDGSKLAFARKRNAGWAILVQGVRGGAVEDISAQAGLPPGFAGYPDWSPDGTKLAFSVQARLGGPLDIVVYDFAAHTLSDLTPDSSNDMRPRWSPDGTKIAFGGSGNAGALDVYVVNSDGSGLTRLTNAPGWQWEPAWSPDGSQIAYTSYPNETTDVYVMDADGTHQRDITNSRTANDTQPSWSARGIAFRSDRSGVGGIFLMQSNGSDVKRLSKKDTFDQDPGWSRDGKQLVFTSARDARSTINVWSPDTGSSRSLTRGPWFDTDPAWSADGKRLAFVRSPARTRSDIYAISADGHAPRNLTRGQGLNWNPAWSPDGTRIAFVRFLNYGAQLWLMRADGSGQRPLTSIGRWNDHPSWSPDGTRLVFSAQRNGQSFR